MGLPSVGAPVRDDLFMISGHAKHASVAFTPSTREAFAADLADLATGKGTRQAPVRPARAGRPDTPDDELPGARTRGPWRPLDVTNRPLVHGQASIRLRRVRRGSDPKEHCLWLRSSSEITKHRHARRELAARFLIRDVTCRPVDKPPKTMAARRTCGTGTRPRNPTPHRGFPEILHSRTIGLLDPDG